MEPHYTWPGDWGGRESKQAVFPGRGREERVLFQVGGGGDRRIALHVDMNVSVEIVHVGRRRKQPGGQEGQSGV